MIGGSQVYYHYLLSQCTAEDVIVITRPAAGAPEHDAHAPYEIVRKSYIAPIEGSPWLKKLVWYALLTPMVLWWVLRYRPAVVHMGHLYPYVIGGWLVARLTGVRLAVTVHGEEVASMDFGGSRLEGWRPQLCDAVGRWALRRCDCVQANSRFTRQLLLQCGVSEDRILVTTPGIDVSKTCCPKHIAPEIAARLVGQRLLLTVGRFISARDRTWCCATAPSLEGAPERKVRHGGRGQPGSLRPLEAHHGGAGLAGSCPDSRKSG